MVDEVTLLSAAFSFVPGYMGKSCDTGVSIVFSLHGYTKRHESRQISIVSALTRAPAELSRPTALPVQLSRGNVLSAW